VLVFGEALAVERCDSGSARVDEVANGRAARVGSPKRAMSGGAEQPMARRSDSTGRVLARAREG